MILISLLTNQNFKDRFLTWMRTKYRFLQNGGADMEEQSSFEKPDGRGLGAPDKISTCDTISITKAIRHKSERRITCHITDRS